MARRPRCAVCHEPHYRYTREATLRDLKRLANKIRRSDIHQKGQIKNIYGVPHGGLAPAWYLSNALGLPLIFCKEEIGPRTLVVDDIAETGKTIIPLRPALIAVLWYHRERCILEPEDVRFWVRLKTNKTGWVEFCAWETRKTTHLSVHKEQHPST